VATLVTPYFDGQVVELLIERGTSKDVQNVLHQEAESLVSYGAFGFAYVDDPVSWRHWLFSLHDHHRTQMDSGYARIEQVLRDVRMWS